MKKIQQFIRRNIAVTVVVLLLLLLTGVFYVVVAKVEPIRNSVANAVKDTVFAGFVQYVLPTEQHDESEHSIEPETTMLQTQLVEISLSPAAAKNIGLDDSSIKPVAVGDYYKSLTLPAVVTQRQGFSVVFVPSPVTGVVSKVYHEEGVSVLPDEPLFDIQLNQQEILKGQADYLALLKKREINAAEIERLKGLDYEIIPKRQRELAYEKEQIDREIAVVKKILLVQGLTEESIAESLEKQELIIRNVTVAAPKINGNNNGISEQMYTVDNLNVAAGKNVTVGESLCQLSDYSKLVIKGKVFAANEKQVSKALETKSRISAIFEGESGTHFSVPDLQIRSIDNNIDSKSGILYCYVDLINHFKRHEIVQEKNIRKYTQWQFKPGQRCELDIEYEKLPNCIVLPLDAVADDVTERCVFEWVGNDDDNKIWRKKTVQVLYQKRNIVAIANDGSIYPGAKIATKGAALILAALNAANQRNSGGGIQHGDHVH
ncbi:MAG: efflux RND transporter periplasmic adaptor subunit [Planctomycetaceae bacterium]|nr:efflux RND transporter periplasmic adaptor subunit [Planctomycetaceae bacterium]